MTAAEPWTRVILEAQLNSLGDLVSSDFAHDVQPEIDSRHDASRRADVLVLAHSRKSLLKWRVATPVKIPAFRKIN